MSPPAKDSVFLNLCFPRVSGDEPVGGLVGESVQLFSPRERG